jgi:hypothetical protein
MKLLTASLLIFLAFAITAAQDLKRSAKKDSIETSYLTEKTASDEFDVLIEVRNKRSKPVRVTVRAKHNRLSLIDRDPTPTPSRLRDLVLGQSQYSDECTVVVAANGNGSCSVTVRATKITGTKIVRWENANAAAVPTPPRIISVTPIP